MDNKIYKYVHKELFNNEELNTGIDLDIQEVIKLIELLKDASDINIKSIIPKEELLKTYTIIKPESFYMRNFKIVASYEDKIDTIFLFKTLLFKEDEMDIYGDDWSIICDLNNKGIEKFNRIKKIIKNYV